VNWRWIAIAGTLVGAVYVLSPLTVWCGLAMVVLVNRATRDLPPGERNVVRALLGVSLAVRVAAVVGLFVMTDHARLPFGIFFGDEVYFLTRSLWLRNVGLGISIHGADLIYAFSELGRTSYLQLLAFIQVLVGPAPYGAHLVGIVFYLASSLMLFRIVRRAFGRVAALGGLVLLMWLPSLFAWSISALKDPLFFLLVTSSVALAGKLVRGNTWRSRTFALIGLVVVTAAVESVRPGGAVITAGGVIVGLAIAWFVQRPPALLAALVIVPILAGAALSRPAVRVGAFAGVQSAARLHWGHVATFGYVYHVLDDRFYPDLSEIADMHFDEMMRFLVRSTVRYVTVPLPWEVRSRASLAFMPEQIVWYLLVLLAPFGILFAFRRDVLVAGLLLGHTLVAAASVAVGSGNIGTLIRHRGLALPYLVWFSVIGLSEWLPRLRHLSSGQITVEPSGSIEARVEPSCP
jgi:hypothetical protein